MGLVFGNKKPIIITHLNTEKRMASYITKDGNVGFFNYARLKKCGIAENKIYLATFVKSVLLGTLIFFIDAIFFGMDCVSNSVNTTAP